ncbi:MAG: hypothetical protein KKC75_04130 [Nanoarchaeota archaeon]|nr:hypothetical protein [Nanoarchaeota archaeon]MBU1004239.1 hypothetical protein [Nanoarchaeota archaeon]MBU1945876.1 hypothetical protein [Nanoarchaeota archaeon]
MEVQEQIAKFKEFIEKSYLPILTDNLRKDKKFLVMDFNELSKFDIELAELILEQPDDLVDAVESAVEQLDLENVKGIRVRFKNLPESQKILVRNIRSKHLNKMFQMTGIVRQKSDVRPQVTAAKFECPSCGNVINVLQLDQSFKEPSRCGCGRKGKFHLLSKELVDAQGLVLEEDPENLDGGEQPKRMNVFLKDDLVSPFTEKKTSPGSKVRVTGIIKEVPVILRTGSQSTRFDLLIEANYIEAVEESFYDVEISDEEVRQIREIAEDPNVYKRLIGSIAPSIYGHDRIKEAILLQMVGGVHKTRQDGVVSRGDMHVLLIGDPGAGKSALLKRANIISPKSRYVSGKGVSAAGLTASVVKDEFLKGWSLEAGAMVLASNGLCCTTEDSEFILENGGRMSFKELFDKTNDEVIYPKFRVFGLNEKTLKVELFNIKRAFKIKNEKKIVKIKTRTGKEISLTGDNEVITCEKSKMIWKSAENLKKGDFVAAPKSIKICSSDKYSIDLAYIAGLIASDGHIKIDKRHATTYFYNTDKELIKIFKEKMNKLGYKFSEYTQKAGRKSKIRGNEFISKRDVYTVYNSTKEFAKKIIEFGVPNGNKSIKFALEGKILTYSEKTIANFLRGVFDGDGSIRLNPIEVTLTTGMKENTILFQRALLRIGIVSCLKKSTNSWHCEVRGAVNCMKFFNNIGTSHPKKYERFIKINPQEVKDRIDILPNHQEFFKELRNKNSGRLGKNKFKYFWNYSRNGVAPSLHKLRLLNILLNDEYIERCSQSDLIWDRIESIKEIKADYVYDFTMDGTNNFVANDIIMHNCIDEMDKISPEDRSSMHEAMENQTVSISKANIQATLIARTTVLAAANPKFGRFDPYGNIAEQIDLPPTLINRFDLIFTIKDLPDEKKDDMLASHILSLHQEPNSQEPEIDTNLLKKYIGYVKRKMSPQLSDGSIEEIKKYYLKMRSSGAAEGGIKTIPISPRQLQALVRMSEANAKVRMSSEVTRKDAKKAIDLLEYSLMDVGFDKETGKIDIDRIATGVSASTRSHIMNVKEIINELEGKIGKTIPIDDIVAAAKAKGIGEDKVEEALEKLKRTGDVFEPRHGFVSKI